MEKTLLEGEDYFLVCPVMLRTGLIDDTSIRGISCDYCHTVKEMWRITMSIRKLYSTARCSGMLVEVF